MSAVFRRRGDCGRRPRRSPSSLSSLWRRELGHAAARRLRGRRCRPHRRDADDRIAWLAVATVVVVAALDGVDGWLARRDAQASSFGARFDMETDAAFILILSVLVWQHGKAGAWVLGCGLMRYVFVAAGLGVALDGGSAAIHDARQERRDRSVRRSRCGALAGREAACQRRRRRAHTGGARLVVCRGHRVAWRQRRPWLCSAVPGLSDPALRPALPVRNGPR